MIIGPSGCGKSTFLRCINGLEPLSGGKVELDGQNISDGSVSRAAICQHIGMVFQSYDLFPHMTVLENIILAPMEVQKRKKEEVTAEARKLLKRIGLEDKENDPSRRIIRRAETAHRHDTRSHHEAGNHAFR